MDYTACSCDNLRKSAFEKAAHDNREDIQAARTLGAAAGLDKPQVAEAPA